MKDINGSELVMKFFGVEESSEVLFKYQLKSGHFDGLNEFGAFGGLWKPLFACAAELVILT